jgi:transposase
MAKTRPPYPAEFREQIVELAHSGRTAAELSREFGCSAQTIANWIAQAAIDADKPLPGKEGLTTSEREELARLRRENDRRSFRSKAEARLALFTYIEGWYNPRRRHSALGYRSPLDYERARRPALTTAGARVASAAPAVDKARTEFIEPA